MLKANLFEKLMNLNNLTKQKHCINKIHYEPLLISVPYGEVIKMKCPDCGKEIIIRGSDIIFKDF